MNRFDKSKNYIFSAWVYPLDGNKITLNVEKRIAGNVAANLGNGNFVFDETKRNKWNLISCMIDFSGFSGMNLPTDYLRINVSSNPGDNAQFFVDEIRFYPSDALMSTTYYDPIWQQPVLSIDANNRPSPLTILDEFGRVSEIWKIDNSKGVEESGYKKTLLSKKEYHLRGALD